MILFSTSLYNIILNSALLIFSIFLLWKGADYLVDSASKVAERLGISELVIGLTVVAMGTSAPEFAVTVNAAFKGQPDISVANIVGSNIFNLGFILGSVAIIKTIETSKKLVYRDGLFMIFITILLTLFFYDLKLSKIEGLIMIVLLIGYLLFLFIRKDENPKEEEVTGEKTTWKDFLLLPVSIGIVILGGHILVDSASFIAKSAHVSQWAIGVTIVAAGTSAPEMATSLVATLKGKHGISAGNLIGSDIFNILGVLGLTSILNPLTIDPRGYESFLMLTIMVFIAVIFLRTGWRLTRWEGVFLLAFGIIRWVFDFIK